MAGLKSIEIALIGNSSLLMIAQIEIKEQFLIPRLKDWKENQLKQAQENYSNWTWIFAR